MGDVPPTQSTSHIQSIVDSSLCSASALCPSLSSQSALCFPPSLLWCCGFIKLSYVLSSPLHVLNHMLVYILEIWFHSVGPHYPQKCFSNNPSSKPQLQTVLVGKAITDGGHSNFKATEGELGFNPELCCLPNSAGSLTSIPLIQPVLQTSQPPQDLEEQERG